jgi:hypothetical protein
MFQNLIPKAFAQAVKPGEKLVLDPGSDWTNLKDISFTKMVTVGLNLSLIIISIIFFFVLIFGGLKWIMSEGDEKKLTAARNQVTNALIGLVIVFAAWAIVSLLEVIFGIKILSITIPSLTV